jgi:hypothetical protein
MRSKLEEYLFILQTLLSKGPKKTVEIENLLQIDGVDLVKDLTFLLEQNAVEADVADKLPTYAVTVSGVRIIKYFGLQTPLPDRY